MNFLNNLIKDREVVENKYNCDKCQDTGYIIENDVAYRCPCKKIADVTLRKQNGNMTPLRQRQTFESFDFGYYKSTKTTAKGETHRHRAETVLKACKDFAIEPKQHGIFLQGNVGCGKTFLASAICNKLAEQGTPFMLWDTLELLDTIKNGLKANTDTETLTNKIKTIKVLVLDDLGVNRSTDWENEFLFTIINHRTNHELPIVVTTNLKLSELEERMGSRLTSRLLENCNFYSLQCDVDIRREIALKRMGK